MLYFLCIMTVIFDVFVQFGKITKRLTCNIFNCKYYDVEGISNNNKIS